MSDLYQTYRVKPAPDRPAPPSDPVPTKVVEPSQRNGVTPVQFRFTGSGREYFRVWFVNVVLSLLSLGVYSPWAKVRRMRYLYRHTELAGSAFDYHGAALPILKGRAILVSLLLVFNLAYFYLDQRWAWVGLAILVLALPWLIWKSAQFRLAATSYRGVHLGFSSSLGDSYYVFLLLPILLVITGLLGGPFFYHRMKSFFIENVRFGRSSFDFQASLSDFYKVGLVALGLSLVPWLVVGGVWIADFIDGKTALGCAVVVAYFVQPYVSARITSLVWSTTTLGAHEFKCDIKPGKLFWIRLSNSMAILLTAGFFTPFAQMRQTKYVVEQFYLLPAGDINTFLSGRLHDESAGRRAVDPASLSLSL